MEECEICLGLGFVELGLGGLEDQPALLLFDFLEIELFGKEFGHVTS